MLKFFRKHARGWFMLAIIVIIILVFVLYFGSNRGSRSADAIAIVDGKVISEAEFHNEHGKMLDMVKLRYGSKLTPEELKMMNLKQKVYDNLINQQIIIAKAADLKLQISNDELRNAITSIPALQTDGIFDERKYHQMLRYTKSSADDFEATQRINLTASKIESLVREGIKISDQEIYDLYTHCKIKKSILGLYKFPARMLKVILLTPQKNWKIISKTMAMHSAFRNR